MKYLLVLIFCLPISIDKGYVQWCEGNIEVTHFEDGTELFTVKIMEIKL